MTETINWDKFDKQVDSEEIKSAVEDAKKNDFPDIPDGEYEVALEDMVLKTSKKWRSNVNNYICNFRRNSQIIRFGITV